MHTHLDECEEFCDALLLLETGREGEEEEEEEEGVAKCRSDERAVVCEELAPVVSAGREREGSEGEERRGSEREPLTLVEGSPTDRRTQI